MVQYFLLVVLADDDVKCLGGAGRGRLALDFDEETSTAVDGSPRSAAVEADSATRVRRIAWRASLRAFLRRRLFACHP